MERVVLGQERVVLSQERVVLGQERVVLGQERVVLSQERVVLGQERVGLGQERVVLGQERVYPSPSDSLLDLTLESLPDHSVDLTLGSLPDHSVELSSDFYDGPLYTTREMSRVHHVRHNTTRCSEDSRLSSRSALSSHGLFKTSTRSKMATPRTSTKTDLSDTPPSVCWSSLLTPGDSWGNCPPQVPQNSPDSSLMSTVVSRRSHSSHHTLSFLGPRPQCDGQEQEGHSRPSEEGHSRPSEEGHSRPSESLYAVDPLDCVDPLDSEEDPSLPPTWASSRLHTTMDSDATLFMDAPLSRKAVTQKEAHHKRKAILGKLKKFKRHLLAAAKGQMNTLAVL